MARRTGTKIRARCRRRAPVQRGSQMYKSRKRTSLWPRRPRPCSSSPICSEISARDASSMRCSPVLEPASSSSERATKVAVPRAAALYLNVKRDRECLVYCREAPLSYHFQFLCHRQEFWVLHGDGAQRQKDTEDVGPPEIPDERVVEWNNCAQGRRPRVKTKDLILQGLLVPWIAT